MPSAHFSKAFLASVPPFNPAHQTDATDHDAAAEYFGWAESKIYGGFAGLMLLHRTVVVHGRLPESVRYLQSEV